MAWIKVIQEVEAKGRLKDIYDRYIEPWGGVDNPQPERQINEDPL